MESKHFRLELRKKMGVGLKLPIIDLASPNRSSVAISIRQACIEYGFFYLVNHGVEEELLAQVFDQSSKFYSLPLEYKSKLARKELRGYTASFAEKLDPSSKSKGDSKESFHIDPIEDVTQNQWPSEGIELTIINVDYNTRTVMILLHGVALLQISFHPGDRRWNPTKKNSAGKKLASLIAPALHLDEDYFEKVGLNKHTACIRLLHYTGQLRLSEEELGASAHSDYSMITLLASNGVLGLQVCREKSKHPQVWEDVLHIDGAFIVNIGDMLERWTNCLFKSTVHRVIPTGQERYSVIIVQSDFFCPNEETVIECLPSCCNESSPPRFPPIRSRDYLRERIALT